METAYSFEIELSRCNATGLLERDDELEYRASVISVAFPLSYQPTDCLFVVSGRHLFSSKCCNDDKDLMNIGSLEGQYKTHTKISPNYIASYEGRNGTL